MSTSEPRDAQPPSRAALVREVWIASLAVLAVLAVVKHVGVFVPFVGEHAFTIAAAFQLYVPVYLIGRRGITAESLGLTFAQWKSDLKWVAILAVIVTVPFAIGHHYWQTELFHRTFRLRFPPDFVESVVVQVLVVGLAEELYFRGYLQGRMQELWPAKHKIVGAPVGGAIFAAAAVFALAHFVGEYRPDRLGPFFPALLFGWLRARTTTIVGAVGFHAFCNVLADVLWACYRPG